MDNGNDKKYLVDGFEFFHKEDADTARKEAKGIEYLKERADFTDPIQVLNIYNKLLEKGLFQTPVGYSNLIEMQKFLRQQETFESSEIKNIPIGKKIINLNESDMKSNSKVPKLNPSAVKKRQKNYQQYYKNSLILNILFVIAIIIMFYISYTGENATILNYETKIVDRYSVWEQELTEREKVVEDLENKQGYE